ncbi:MAG: hypothetical protein IJ529_03670 [Alphaproteobacteria bacterium]|nr:hypothetical protein [Alphaproteobacteria bacterium]
MSENQSEIIAKAKMEASASLTKGFVTDFKPMLENVKDLVNHDGDKTLVNQKIDTMLHLIAQLEKFSSVNGKD